MAVVISLLRCHYPLELERDYGGSYRRRMQLLFPLYMTAGKINDRPTVRKRIDGKNRFAQGYGPLTSRCRVRLPYPRVALQARPYRSRSDLIGRSERLITVKKPLKLKKNKLSVILLKKKRINIMTFV